MTNRNSRKPVVRGLDHEAREINSKLSRNLPLSMHELSIVKWRSAGTYGTIISQNFRSAHDTLGKRRFSEGRKLDREKEIRANDQTRALMLNRLKEASNKTDKKLQEIQQLEEEYYAAHSAYLAAKNTASIAEAKLKEARESLDGCYKNEGFFSDEYDHTNGVAKELGLEVLVHRSANLHQLRQYQFRTMVVTSEDQKIAEEVGCADKVVNASKNIQVLPKNLYGREWSEEERSAVAFASMVIQYREISPETPYIHASELVAKILRMNGK